MSSQSTEILQSVGGRYWGRSQPSAEFEWLSELGDLLRKVTEGPLRNLASGN